MGAFAFSPVIGRVLEPSLSWRNTFGCLELVMMRLYFCKSWLSLKLLGKVLGIVKVFVEKDRDKNI